MLRKLIGTKEFYRRVILLALPIMIQNGITNFVNMLDNIMVGRIGTVEMTGVAVANQLFFVFNLCIFGAVSGAGIFGAQFAGNADHKGVRDTFRFKIVFCTVLTILCIVLFVFFGEPLISLYLKGEGDLTDAAASLSSAKEYLTVMLIGMLPYTFVQCYSSTLRETGETVLPMAAGVIAVTVNLALNTVLIFGYLGFPALGVKGAAIATVISRFAELAVVAVRTQMMAGKNPFIIGAFRSLKVPFSLTKKIFIKGLPLMLNETMWAAGIAIVNQCYSVISYDVVAASNICSTFFNVFSTAFMAVGVADGIILGQKLGAGETEDAKEVAFQLITFSALVSAVVGLVFFACARVIPLVYNATDGVRDLAGKLMMITAAAAPVDAIVHASYFTLRSGGKALITFLFDSCFVWVVNIPIAFLLSRYSDIGILGLYAIVQFSGIIKDILGITFVNSGMWIIRIVPEAKEKECSSAGNDVTIP